MIDPTPGQPEPSPPDPSALPSPTPPAPKPAADPRPSAGPGGAPDWRVPSSASSETSSDWMATEAAGEGGSTRRAPSAVQSTRRPSIAFAALFLALGLATGAGVTAVVARNTSSSGPLPALHVDASPLPGSGGTVVDVARRLGPAVGTIIARHRAARDSALGSGFVIAHDGTTSYLLTNNHVVEGANDLHVVMPDGRNLRATIVGTDAFDDLAVVSVPAVLDPVAVFGDSDALQVGQQVIAIGSPLGNEGSVTVGVVSALHRTIRAGANGSAQSETLQDVLQTDASINPGNSGGPLADSLGRVVGVNVAIAGDANNIGYSIPSNLAQSVARRLMAHQPIQHPFLGIQYLSAIDATLDGRGFDGPGVLVTGVQENSPAAKAGFQSGDILQAVDGVAIDNGITLGGLIQRHHVGDRITCTVRRGNQTLTLTPVLGERPGT